MKGKLKQDNQLYTSNVNLKNKVESQMKLIL